MGWPTARRAKHATPGGCRKLVNDLDLTVEEVVAAGRVIASRYGNLFRENIDRMDSGFSRRFTGPPPSGVRDATNNVEAVFIPAGALPAGTKLRIKVRGQNVTGEAQRFAVYAYNVRPNN